MKVVHFLNCSRHSGDAFVLRAAQEGVRTSEALTLHHDHGPFKQRLIEMHKVLRPHSNSVLHIHTGGQLVRLADVMAIHLLPFDARITTVHAPSDWTIYGDSERHKRAWRLASKGMDLVLCPSSYARKIQLEAGLKPSKVRVQYNPVDITFIKSGDRTILRQQLGLADEDLLVLFLARLDSDKRPTDAINAFSAIAHKFPRAFLALAGSGEQELECRELIQNLHLVGRVHLLGYRTDTANLLKAADIYILPTKWENLSMSLLEALAAGLPIITTPVGGNLEVVKAEETAILTDVGDIISISVALERLLQDKELRQTMGANAYEVAHHFSLSTIVQQQIALYREVMSTQSTKLAAPGT